MYLNIKIWLRNFITYYDENKINNYNIISQD